MLYVFGGGCGVVVGVVDRTRLVKGRGDATMFGRGDGRADGRGRRVAGGGCGVLLIRAGSPVIPLLMKCNE